MALEAPPTPFSGKLDVEPDGLTLKIGAIRLSPDGKQLELEISWAEDGGSGQYTGIEHVTAIFDGQYWQSNPQKYHEYDEYKFYIKVYIFKRIQGYDQFFIAGSFSEFSISGDIYEVSYLFEGELQKGVEKT